MKKANGIAAPNLACPTPRVAILAVLSSLLLAACGGGATTADNPQAPPVEDTGAAPYAGPAPRDADVQSFKVAFWEKPDRATAAVPATTNRSVSRHCLRAPTMSIWPTTLPCRRSTASSPALSEFGRKSARPPSATTVGWTTRRCGSIVTNWIENWVGEPPGGGRQIILTAPESRDPSESKNFPTDPTLFAQLVHEPILREYCSDCHSSESPNAQQPYFADPDINVAYDAAKSKINLDTPADSRFVGKVSPVPFGESHNCWFNNDCSASSADMLGTEQPPAGIAGFAAGIVPTAVNPDLVYSKAVRLVDGTPASGGNRYEDTQIALWEFKTGDGTHRLRHQRRRPGDRPDVFGRRQLVSAAGASRSATVRYRGPAKPRARPRPARSYTTSLPRPASFRSKPGSCRPT